MPDNKGRVYIIGAGPGDWGLITHKGLSIIKKADVILYDFLASKDLLNYAKIDARIICVGKADGLHLFEQSKINKTLLSHAQRGKIVVRLKGGDPFLFSRGIEEALYLKRKGVKFEIIPGITSAFAAAESFGIPLTRKGKYSSVTVLTGRKSNGKPIDVPLSDTLIYLMAVGNIRNVVKAIIDSGRSKDTPCAFIERATSSKERIIEGRLSNIEAKVKVALLMPPAVFIVGKVVNYGKKIYADKFRN